MQQLKAPFKTPEVEQLGDKATKPIISKAIAANQYDIRNYLAKGEQESQRRLDDLNEARSNRMAPSNIG